MTQSHEYPYMSPKTAIDVLKKETYAVESHDKYLRATPQIEGTDQHAHFVYEKDLENRLKEVARNFSDRFAAESSGGTSRDDSFFEQQCEHSVAWYRQLKDLPVAVIEDDGFWRYLTVAVLAAESAVRSYIAGKDIHVGAMESNVAEDGSTKRSSDILAKRMYVRGRLYSEDNGPPKTGQEFESSHVYPGGTADTRAAWQKAMCAAFEKKVRPVPDQSEAPKTTPMRPPREASPVTKERSQVMDRGRDVAKKVNAARSARVASMYSDAAAKRIVERLD